jgi:hypothetical protein
VSSTEAARTRCALFALRLATNVIVRVVIGANETEAVSLAVAKANPKDCRGLVVGPSFVGCSCVGDQLV